MDNSRHGQGRTAQTFLPRFALPVVIGTGCLLHAGLAAAQIISFSDSFTPPSTLWSNSSGWTASGGQYSALIPNNSPLALTMLPFNFSSDNFQLTVTVNQLGDGGIFFQSLTPANSVLFVDGGQGYGQGTRDGIAGTVAYWGTPDGVFNPRNGAFIPGDTYILTLTDIGGTLSAYTDVDGHFDSNSLLLTTFVDPSLTSFQIGLYDDQPGSRGGFGAPQSFSNFSVSGTASVPEPGTLGLLGLGLAGLAFFRRRRPH